APVARVLASSVTAMFPPAKRSPMIPDPMTMASRSAVPSASAARRRGRSNGRSGGSRLAGATSAPPSLGKRRAYFGATLATIFRQIDEQRAHAVEIGRVDDRSSVAAADHQTGIGQDGQLRRERVGRDLQ